MTKHVSLNCRLLACIMLLAVSLNAQTTKLPIADFLAAQGQTSSFLPPVPDYLGWLQALCTSGGLSCLTSNGDFDKLCLGDGAAVDYAGLADRFITQNGGQSSGTVMDGSVLVRPLDAGHVQVEVTLNTRNALTFVVQPSALIPGTSCAAFADVDLKAGPLVLGARALPIPPLAQRALGDSLFHITFVNPTGAPLPDLMDLFNNRFGDIKEYSFNASASGPTPDGGQGTVTIVQAGNGERSNIQPAIVNFRQIGK
jgi:hypothetical protein